MTAAEAGRTKIVGLLLKNGADKSQKDSEDMTALDYAEADIEDLEPGEANERRQIVKMLK